MTGASRTLLAFAAFAVILAIAPMVFASGTSVTMMSVMGVMIIFALSYNMLLGETGLLSFGHAVYYGLAGFFAAHQALPLVPQQHGLQRTEGHVDPVGVGLEQPALELVDDDKLRCRGFDRLATI